MRSLYARLPSTNFSEDVLGTRPANLAVLPVRGVTWSDWGEPARVFGTLERLGIHPEWAESGAVDGSGRGGGKQRDEPRLRRSAALGPTCLPHGRRRFLRGRFLVVASVVVALGVAGGAWL